MNRNHPTEEQFAQLIEATASLTHAITHGPLAQLAITDKGDLLTPSRQTAPFKTLPFGMPQTFGVDNDDPVYFGISIGIEWAQTTPIIPAVEYARQINHIHMVMATAARNIILQKRSVENATVLPPVSGTPSGWTAAAVPIPGLVAVTTANIANSVFERTISNGSMELAAGEAVFGWANAAVVVRGYMTFARVDK